MSMNVTDHRVIHLTILAILMACPLVLAEEAPLIPARPSITYEQMSTSAWRPLGVKNRPFWFTLGGADESPVHRETIRRKQLGDVGFPMFGVAEWCYSFHHLKNGQLDGAGYKHYGGYPTPPKTREEAAQVVHGYFDRLVKDARAKATPEQQQMFFSINGHYCYQHYGCEWGCDMVGSEVGENINSTQAHIAFTRGAARQYGKPWLIDFSSWYGPSMYDEDPKKTWGDYSGPENGHSLSLHHRTYMVAYMAGADVMIAEGGHLNFFRSQQPGDDGTLPLSRLGETGAKFYQFTKRHPNRGIAYTPFALVIDKLHGIFPGFGNKQAWDAFPYTRGDQRILDIWEIFFPDSVDVQQKKNEKGYLVESPLGDTLDVLLTSASDDVLSAYPVLLVAGELTDDVAVGKRLAKYTREGGVVLLCEEDARRPAMREALSLEAKSLSNDRSGYVRQPLGRGWVIIYSERGKGANRPLVNVLKQLHDEWVPVRVLGKVETLVNRTPKGWVVTLVNNEGITKSFRSPPEIDASLTQKATLQFVGKGEIESALLWGEESDQPLDGNDVNVEIPPGEVRVIELVLKN